MDVLDVIVSAALSVGLTYTVVACDRLGLSREQRARGWNAASTGSALLAFAPLCIVAHFWVTRRSLAGLLLGLAWLLILIALQLGLTILAGQAGVIALVAVIVLVPLVPSLVLPLAIVLLLAGR